MSTRPYRRPDDPQLAQLYDAQMAAASAPVGADRAPGLITAVPTFAELRRTPGDVAGASGPPAITVSGIKTPGDNGPAMTFVWKPGSTQQDNNGDNSAGPGVVAVVGVDRGRWVRASAADETAALDVFTSTAAGLAPASGGGTVNYLRADGSWSTPPAPAGKTLLGPPRVITSGTSITPTAGCTLAIFDIQGSGGGGGGVPTATGGQNATAAGGEAGPWALFATTTIPVAFPVGFGAKGTGGANTGANGGNGGDTTLSDGVTTVTVQGGRGGSFSGPSASPSSVAGGSGATATNGTVNGSGVPGLPGFGLASGASPVMRGGGGNSRYGGAGRGGGVITGATAGANATGYGSGGAGAGAASGSGSGAVGGDGMTGVIVMWEFGG